MEVFWRQPYVAAMPLLYATIGEIITEKVAI